jgi:hypothetical protein
MTSSDSESLIPKAAQKESTADFAAWIRRLSVESKCKIFKLLRRNRSFALMPLRAFCHALFCSSEVEAAAVAGSECLVLSPLTGAPAAFVPT